MKRATGFSVRSAKPRRHRPSDSKSKMSRRWEEVPAEIWSQIFQSPNLRKQDITNITRVCQSFRHIAQPLLFEEVVVTHRFGKSHTGSYWQRVEDFTRFLHRFDFITSEPRITTAVKSLVYVISKSDGTQSTFPAYKAIEAMYGKLSLLPNLRSFAAQCIPITPQLMEQLSGLQHLRHLHLSGPDVKVTSMPPLYLDTFLLEGYCELDLDISRTWYMPMLEPSRLGHLGLSSLEVKHEVMTALKSWPRLPSLRILHLRAKDAEHPDFVDFLRKCPAVEELILPDTARYRSWSEWNTPVPVISDFPKDILPRLTSIMAPREFVLGILPGREVRRVNVNTVLQNADEVLLKLKEASPYVEELSLLVESFSSLLLSLQEQFRHLRRGYITLVSSCSNDMDQHFPMILDSVKQSNLSMPLECLRIRCKEERLGSIIRITRTWPRPKIPTARKLRELIEGLKQEYPRLKDMVVTDREFSIYCSDAGATYDVQDSEDWSWKYRSRFDSKKA